MTVNTVSIIIPAFNVEIHLNACLASIRDLDYPRKDIEVIVVDNGSTDRTRDIARSFGVTLLREDTLNVSGLRNLGAKNAAGGILAFIDADCIVARDWLKTATEYFYDLRTAAWGAPPMPPENPTWVQKTWYLIRKKDHKVQRVQWLESMNFFVRRELYHSIGGFNESLVTCEDVDLSYRISRFGDILSDDRIKVIHLGEARDLLEFVRKEIWRGQGNLAGLWSHGLSIRELPSLFLPIYFAGLMLVAAFLLTIDYTTERLLILMGLAILPSLIVLYKKRKKIYGLKQLAQLFLLLQVYFGSRTLALLKKGR